MGQMKSNNKRALSKRTVEELIRLSKQFDKGMVGEGDKVRLNIEKITSGVSFNRLSLEYKEFVLSNVNTIFTVVNDKNKKFSPGNKPIMVCLEEDSKDPKWLFCVYELKKVNKEG